MAQTPRLFKELEEWMRHRVRAIQLKHWKRRKIDALVPFVKVSAVELCHVLKKTGR
nr:group II intron maturase-specific domain-containing protein [Sinorhizobium meliloti]